MEYEIQDTPPEIHEDIWGGVSEEYNHVARNCHNDVWYTREKPRPDLFMGDGWFGPGSPSLPQIWHCSSSMFSDERNDDVLASMPKVTVYRRKHELSDEAQELKELLEEYPVIIDFINTYKVGLSYSFLSIFKGTVWYGHRDTDVLFGLDKQASTPHSIPVEKILRAVSLMGLVS